MFKTGDTVALKSGGQAMTITSVTDNQNAVCIYFFDGGDLAEVTVPTSTLMHVDMAHGPKNLGDPEWYEANEQESEGFEESIVDSEYLHISNGGVNFDIIDSEFGPAIEIKARQFGHQTGGMRLYVTPEVLTRLSMLFAAGSIYAFTNDPYVIAINPSKKTTN